MRFQGVQAAVKLEPVVVRKKQLLTVEGKKRTEPQVRNGYWKTLLLRINDRILITDLYF